METLVPFIGFAAFPVAIGASFIAYAITGSSRTIGYVLIVTLIVAVGLWALVRNRAAWRKSARMSNELLMALLVATIGFTLAIGGIAAVSIPWIGAGAVVLAIAWFVQRGSTTK